MSLTLIRWHDDRVVPDADALTASVRELSAGSKAEVVYRRGNDERTASVTVANAADQKGK